MGQCLDLDCAIPLIKIFDQPRRPISFPPSVVFPSVFFTLLCFICNFPGRYSATQAGNTYQDAAHITAMLGDSVVFNCPVEFPGDHPVPYVLQWEKRIGDTGQDVPIFIWYENYPTHSGVGYEGRVSRVSPDSPYGLASLNLTNIRESDQGWYECVTVFLNRPPSSQNKNGSLFHLDVHAPPRFIITPEEIIYVNIGDAIILNCQADGTPPPEIIWYKDEHTVEPNFSTGIFNEGTELRISSLRNDDIGDYTCIARNGEGQISHTARVIIAGAAVIIAPPVNQTRLEGERVEFSCGARALPGNVSVQWSKDGVNVRDISSIENKFTIRKDGTLVLNPINGDDSGKYTCSVSNGIGNAQTASAYLNTEFPAKVTFTPTVQYLPWGLGGMIQCHIKANPPLQYVTWTKDKRLLEPYQTKDIVVMNNGSLFFTKVHQNHQGRYTCTPYNAQGTQGSSGQMEIIVKKPPIFTIYPDKVYQKRVGETIEMACDAEESEGTGKPKIRWERKDLTPLPKNRVHMSEGNITIESLRRSDFGAYRCVVSNEVATIVASTNAVVEGTQPHAPYNVSVIPQEFTAYIEWLPGYTGDADHKQEYTIWYRIADSENEWTRIPVERPSDTSATIMGLKPSTHYEFQVVGKNPQGGGMLSPVVQVRTLDVLDCNNIIYPSDTTQHSKGLKPGPPRNISVTEVDDGFLISWEPPLENADMVKYYTIIYRIDAQWRDLTKNTKIKPEETTYLVKNMVGGRTYIFKIISHHSNITQSASEEVKYSVPARVKQKAITAGVVGGILFFIVAIILSVCAVKICNKRKRRKQEKAYNIVACRITDARNGGHIPPVRQMSMSKNDERGLTGCINNGMLHLLARCMVYPHRTCVFTRDSEDYDAFSMHRVRPISRAPDGRFILSNSRCSSISSSIDDGGFLTHPAFRNFIYAPPQSRRFMEERVPSDLSSYDISAEIMHMPRGMPRGFHPPPVSVIYSSHTPFLSSSPSSTVFSPMLSPGYFSDLSSVRQASSIERTIRSIHEQYSQELPSLKVIHEEAEKTSNIFPPPVSTDKGPDMLSMAAKMPPRHARYVRSAPELASLQRLDESRSSSSGLGSKNTSQQTASTSGGGGGGSENMKLPYKNVLSPLTQSTLLCDNQLPGIVQYPPHHPYYSHPPPIPRHAHPSMIQPVKPQYLRTWLDYTPSPTQSVTSNKPLSVDDHYEFDAIFPASPTPTEMVLTPLPTPATRGKPSPQSRNKQEDIEARVQAMKEEFKEYKRRQAQMKRLKELESSC